MLLFRVAWAASFKCCRPSVLTASSYGSHQYGTEILVIVSFNPAACILPRCSLHTFCLRVDVIWQVADIDIRFLLEYDVGAFFCYTGLQYHFSAYAGQGF